jgi:hypothetical protein
MKKVFSQAAKQSSSLVFSEIVKLESNATGGADTCRIQTVVISLVPRTLKAFRISITTDDPGVGVQTFGFLLR